MKISQKLAAVAVVASMALAGCGSSDGTPTTEADGSDATPPTEAGGSETTEGGGEGDAVTIVDFAYDPDPLEVDAGAAVTFTNEDSASHTATSTGEVPEDFDTGELGEGDSKEITFGQPGTYTYFCDIHNYMKGSVEVK